MSAIFPEQTANWPDQVRDYGEAITQFDPASATS